MLKKWIRLEISFVLLFMFLMSGIVFAMTPEEIATNSNPSVVRILIEVKPRDNKLLQFYFNRAGQRFKEPIRVKAGSGFIINENGYIITAYHVVTPLGLSPTIYVRLPKEGDFLAQIVAKDEERQLACLKIQKNNLIPLKFAQDPMSVGNEVYTMGYPLAAVTSEVTDKEATFTEGKVSAIKQTRQEAEFIQTNAALNLGNAGGPLLNKDGNLGGIVIYSNDKSFAGRYFNLLGSFKELFADTPSVGIGFAGPAKYVMNMLKNANIEFTVGKIIIIPPQKIDSDEDGVIDDNDKCPDTPRGQHVDKNGCPIKAWFEKPLIWIVGILLLLAGLVSIMLGRKKPSSSPDSQSQKQADAKNTSISFGSIKFTNGELAGKIFPLTAKGLSIGRDSDNDICLTVETVSRKHCWIGLSGSGIVVKDIGSTNGTYINGAKIEGTKPVKTGDVVSLSKSGQEAFTISE